MKEPVVKAYQTKNIKYIFWIRKIKKLLEKHSTIIYLLVYIKYIKKKKTIFVAKASN
jgi:energy-converting hydrogenase Eha subunit C